jgi:malate synthase
MAKGIEILATPPSGAERVLSPEALAFVEKLHRQFQPVRRDLLDRRAKRHAEFDAGTLPTFLQETESVRTAADALGSGELP